MSIIADWNIYTPQRYKKEYSTFWGYKKRIWARGITKAYIQTKSV